MSKIPPAKASDFTAEELTAADADMNRILEQEPQLNDFGYGTYAFHDPAKRQISFQKDRKSIREQESLAQFIVARRWLRQFDKRKSLCKHGTSYGLKHVAEHSVGYMTNGVFIAAAIAEGFRVQRCGNGPNALLNIPARAWRYPNQRGWI